MLIKDVHTVKIDVQTHSLTVQDLVVARVGHDILPVFGPIKVSDETGVTLFWEHNKRYCIKSLQHMN